VKLSLIVAMNRDGVIGRDGGLPWDRIPEDMALFRKLTMGNAIIMGRKTWDSFGRQPLKGRKHVILSRSLTLNDMEYNGDVPIYIARTPAESIAEAFDMHEEAFVIGGAEVYKLLAPLCDKAHVTTVKGYFNGDTYFPFCFRNNPEWELAETTDLREGVDYRRYVRRPN